MAANAASRRSSGGESEVATTTTERASPASPRSSSRNSRTSRPRSPTRASTATSQAVWRASMASRRRLADAGAGEQAEPLALAAGGEAVERAHADIEPRTQPRPLRRLGRCGAHAARRWARPAAARARPAAGPADPARGRASHPTPAAFRRSARRPGWGWNRAALPGPSPSSAAERHRLRQAVAEADDLRRYSVRRRAPPAAGGRRRETCPLSPSISTTRPDSPVTRPSRRSGAMSCSPARHAAVRSSRVVHLIETT